MKTERNPPTDHCIRDADVEADILEMLQRAIDGDEIDIIRRSDYDKLYELFREKVAGNKGLANRKFRSTRLDTNHWRITIRSSRPVSVRTDAMPAVLASTPLEAAEILHDFERHGMVARIVMVANTGELAVVVTSRGAK